MEFWVKRKLSHLVNRYILEQSSFTIKARRFLENSTPIKCFNRDKDFEPVKLEK